MSTPLLPTHLLGSVGPRDDVDQYAIIDDATSFQLVQERQVDVQAVDDGDDRALDHGSVIRLRFCQLSFGRLRFSAHRRDLHRWIATFIYFKNKQWRRSRGTGKGRNLPPSPKFWAVGKFSHKNDKFGLKTPVLGKFRAKLKFRAPIISFVGNLQLSFGKLQIAVPTFLKTRRRNRLRYLYDRQRRRSAAGRLD